MDTVTINTKHELARHGEAIETLFLECFGDRLSVALWRWAYLDNPHGAPWVSLCYDGTRLVGHYAMIPLPLTSSQGRLNSFLSMTTMVAASHRQHGLFVKLGQATYDAAKAAGAAVVMGFPNEMSAPGFKKRLNWDLPASDYVASVSKAQLLDVANRVSLVDPAGYHFDLSDEVTRSWRLSRPGAQYQWRDGLAYKEFGDTLDLIAFDTVDQLAALPDERRINLLVPAEMDAFADFKSFDYPFGGLALARAFEPSQIVRQMAMSDVF